MSNHSNDVAYASTDRSGYASRSFRLSAARAGRLRPAKVVANRDRRWKSTGDALDCAVVNRGKSYEVGSYVPGQEAEEQRICAGKAEEKHAVYVNRQQVRGCCGKILLGSAADGAAQLHSLL